jgi:hypothetical protein
MIIGQYSAGASLVHRLFEIIKDILSSSDAMSAQKREEWKRTNQLRDGTAFTTDEDLIKFVREKLYGGRRDQWQTEKNYSLTSTMSKPRCSKRNVRQTTASMGLPSNPFEIGTSQKSKIQCSIFNSFAFGTGARNTRQATALNLTSRV